MNQSVLYSSYDGVLEPLGQSQVLGYLEHLAKVRLIHLGFIPPASGARKTFMGTEWLAMGCSAHNGGKGTRSCTPCGETA